MVFLQLFYTFFKIGLFGFGGGYAMLSMIQGEVVTRYGWLTAQEFTDIVAISQMTPGPIGINSATYVGYRFNDKEKVNIDDPSHIVAITRDNFYKLPYEDGKTKYRYVVTALDRLHNESKSVGKKIKL